MKLIQRSCLTRSVPVLPICDLGIAVEVAPMPSIMLVLPSCGLGDGADVAFTLLACSN